MRERPILFSGAMIRAILAGTKTQTRRLVRIDDSPITAKFMARRERRSRRISDPLDPKQYQRGIPADAQNVRMCGDYLKCDAVPGSVTVSNRVLCPYGTRRDRLWVRETHRVFGWNDAGRASVEYRADGAKLSHNVDVRDFDAWVDRRATALERQGAIVEGEDDGAVLRLPEGVEQAWTPSIFLQRWASRLTLAVESVRVERLNAITEGDAAAEGVGQVGVDEDDHTHVAKFRHLWDSINGTRCPWAANPWVWRVSFRRVEGP